MDGGAESLAVGPESLLRSLAESWESAGLGRLRLILVEAEPTSAYKFASRQKGALRAEKPDKIEVVSLEPDLRTETQWRDVVRSCRTVLCLSRLGHFAELRRLHAVCREEGIPFIPVLVLGDKGVAGPLTLPDDDRCWESAWRQLHRSAVGTLAEKTAVPDEDDERLLVNVAVLAARELHDGVTEPLLKGRVYVLDLETGEGDYHSIAPHPLAHGRPALEWLEVSVIGKGYESDGSGYRDAGRPEAEIERLSLFAKLTSPVAGAFHAWEEGELSQLPLSQCRVAPIDPLSEGPAEMLPEAVSAGFTHAEARREAGLIGLERMASRILERLLPTGLPAKGSAPQTEAIGVGAGESDVEAVCRSLVRCLNRDLEHRRSAPGLVFREARIGAMGDTRCRFYWEALEILRGEPPRVGLADVGGFPAVWVGCGSGGFASAGLHPTLALRAALLSALQHEQNGAGANPAAPADPDDTLRFELPAFGGCSTVLSIDSLEDTDLESIWADASKILTRNGRRLRVLDLGPAMLGAEPPLKTVASFLEGGMAE